MSWFTKKRDSYMERTLSLQRSKMRTYEALKKEKLPIPLNLRQEIEAAELDDSAPVGFTS